MISYRLCQSITDLVNLISTSKPIDGPMIKGILSISIKGVKYEIRDGFELDDMSEEKFKFIEKVYKELENGKYNILPINFIYKEEAD